MSLSSPAQTGAGTLRVSQSYRLFDTAFGTCGIAWSADGVTRLQLPERDAAATKQRIARGGAVEALDPLPDGITETILAVRRYFAGEIADFASVALDLSGAGAFDHAVYAAARGIGFGRTSTYGELARQVGSPGAAREVGQALGRNPIPIVVPCHRITAADGKLGGFSAPGGRATKERLLALEGVLLAL